MSRWFEFSALLLFQLLWIYTDFSYGSRVKNVTSAVTRQMRSLSFPEGSGMGIFFAIGIPLDIPDKSVSLAFYFEANYRVPDIENATNFADYIQDEGFSRKMAYSIVEKKLNDAGYPGRMCLLRAICEASRTPVTENGLIGDILHIFFTPSSSKAEQLPIEITSAEHEDNCPQKYECSMSLLDLISYYVY